MVSAPIAGSQPENAQCPGGKQSRGVTTTDVLKVVGVAMLLIDHYGLFFDPDQTWWRVFGRIAAPIFFFLIGFARTRSVPWTWIAFGIALTALDVWTSWDEGLQDTGLNILLNFALLRVAVLPLMEWIMRKRPPALAVFVIGCVLLISLSDCFLEYGTSGWLWALLGLSVRIGQEGPSPGYRWIRVALALVAAGAYVVRESIDHELSAEQVVTLAGMIAGLTAGLLAFRRTVLRVQPPAPFALLFRFCGRYSLEIYAITLFAMQFLGHALGTDEGADSDDDGDDEDDDDDDDEDDDDDDDDDDDSGEDDD
jgi:hypothetical protein